MNEHDENDTNLQIKIKDHTYELFKFANEYNVPTIK